MLKKMLVILVLLLMSPCHVSSAKSSLNTFSAVNSILNTSDLSKAIKDAEKILSDGNISSKKAENLASEIATVSADLSKEMDYVKRQSDLTEKQLAVFGDKSEDNEPKEITRRRQQVNAELMKYKAALAEAEFLLNKSDNLQKILVNYSRDKLMISLSERSPVLVSPKTWSAFIPEMITLSSVMFEAPLKWYNSLTDIQKKLVKIDIMPGLFIAFMALLLGRYIRQFLLRRFGCDPEIEDPKYNRRLLAAFCVTISMGVLPASVLVGMLIWLKSSGWVVSGMFGLIIMEGISSILFFVLVTALSKAIFAPHFPDWAITNIPFNKSKLIKNKINLIFAVFLIHNFLEKVMVEANYSADMQVLLAIMADILKGYLIISLSRPSKWKDKHEEHDEDDDEERVSLFTIANLRNIVMIFAGGGVAAAVLGYVALANFILYRIVATFLIVSGLSILKTALSETVTFAVSSKFLRKKLGLRVNFLKKVRFWIIFILDPALILLGLAMVLSLWGVPKPWIKNSFDAIVNGFSFAGINISLFDIAASIIVFMLLVSVVRFMKDKLLHNVLAETALDETSMHSLAAGFSYVGFILAGMVSIAVLGVDLTNLALVAGALSFGIGLGLQNVVNNFVSGIIILVERPIKVGDWVVVNDKEGIVKQINIRATELETWQKANVIIPNAEILSNYVTNYTHKDKYGRITVEVGVAYGSDTAKVTKILIDVAKNHQHIMSYPEPFVIFNNFGDSSLNFELKCFTANIFQKIHIASDMRYQIDKAFIENGIEIPFPQRVVHMVKD